MRDREAKGTTPLVLALAVCLALASGVGLLGGSGSRARHSGRPCLTHTPAARPADLRPHEREATRLLAPAPRDAAPALPLPLAASHPPQDVLAEQKHFPVLPFSLRAPPQIARQAGV